MLEKEIKVRKLSKGYLLESNGDEFAFASMDEVVKQIVEVLENNGIYTELRLKLSFFSKKKSD